MECFLHVQNSCEHLTKIKNEGSRFTILQAGSQIGFLDGCNFWLNSKSSVEIITKQWTGHFFKIGWLNNLGEQKIYGGYGQRTISFSAVGQHFLVKKSQVQEWLLNHMYVVEFELKLIINVTRLKWHGGFVRSTKRSTYIFKFHPRIRVNLFQTCGKIFMDIVKNLFWQTGKN